MFDWAYVDAAGETTGSSEQFESQEAAEAWCGQAWQGLAGEGIAEMILRDLGAGTEVYRMSTAPG